MKKIIFTIFSVLIWFFWFTFADLKITNYQILGQIENDGTIDVQEKIDVHFFDKMHWLERSIPWTYTVQGTVFQVFIDNIHVPNYNYKIMDDYSYDTNIRIWDADKYVKWDQKYEIDYSIYWLIRNFSGMWYSELYWNVIWYWRSNTIENVQVELALPKAYTWLTKDDFLITAWYSDKTSIDDFDWKVTRDENKIYITYNKKLDSYNWITLSVKFSKDYFDFNHEMQEDLLMWYDHDFNIENYKVYWTVERNWNISFQNEIELEILNEDLYIRGSLPYKYEIEGKKSLLLLDNVSIDWIAKDNPIYDTVNSYSTFYINWVDDGVISWDYSIYWLVKPFSWEFEDRAYRLSLSLPILNLSEKIKDLELMLDIPWGCESIYQEDVSIEIWWETIWLSEFNEKYGYIRCHDNKLAMTYSWEIDEYSHITLFLNFVKWTFDLDENLLEALETIWDWKFYYSDETNRQSIIFAIYILLFWWWFKALMSRRYRKQSLMNNKYPIYFDAPKWVDAPEAWILVDNKMDPKDLTALIYQWAVNRYIKILTEKDNEKEFYIKKLKQIPWKSKEYQLNLFNSIFKNWDEFHFSNKKSGLKTALSKASRELNSYINKQKWFKESFYSGVWSSFKRKSLTLVIWVAILWLIAYFIGVILINSSLTPVSSRVKIALLISLILVITSYRNYKEETNTDKKSATIAYDSKIS